MTEEGLGKLIGAAVGAAIATGIAGYLGGSVSSNGKLDAAHRQERVAQIAHNAIVTEWAACVVARQECTDRCGE